MPKKVDAERKRMSDLLDSWRDEVRMPLTNWESEEKARIDAINTRIESIEHLVTFGFVDSQSIKLQIENVKITVIDDSFCEFKEKAEAVKNKVLVYLQDLLEKSIAKEHEEAERKRLEEELRIEAERKAEVERAEREKRIAEEAALKAEQEAAERAKKEKEAAERRELELKFEAEKAKREALEANERAKRAVIESEERAVRAAVEAELRASRWQEDKEKREEDEKRQREADKKHREKIRGDVVQDFMTQGFSFDDARKICAHLEDGVISHVEIIY